MPRFRETGGFARNFIEAFAQGQQVRTRRRLEQEAVEDRVIEKQLLQHRLKEMNISDKLRARNEAKERYDLLNNQPQDDIPGAADMPQRTFGLTDPDFSGGIPQRVTGGGPRLPSITIPGVEGPDTVLQPRTREQNFEQMINEMLAKVFVTPQSASRGETITVGGKVIARGQPYPEPLVPYTTRDERGVETTERIPASEALRRGPAVKQPLPRRPSSGNSVPRVSDEGFDKMWADVVAGNTPATAVPDMKTEYGGRFHMRKPAGFDLTKAQNDQVAFRRYLNGLQTGQQQAILVASETVQTGLNELEALIDRKAADADIKSAADKVRGDLALLKSGGHAPTNKALEMAENELKTGWFGNSASLKPKIARMRKELGYRTAAIKNAFVSSEDVMGPGRQDPSDQFGLAAGAAPSAAPSGRYKPGDDPMGLNKRQ